MATKSETADVSKTDMTVVGATIGSVFSIFWVAATGFFFLKLLERFSADASLLSQLIWPVVVLALGVPLIVFVWFGGSSVVIGLSKLRKQLDKLDEYVDGFNEIQTRSTEIKQNMESASSTVSNAANSFSENIERFQQDVKPLLEMDLAKRGQPSSLTAPVVVEDEELTEVKRRFGAIMSAANSYFYAALTRRNERPGKGNRRIVVAPGGADKFSIAEQLAQDGFLSPPIATLVKDIYYLDMSTRSTGRKTVKKDELSSLEDRIKTLGSASPESPEAA